MQLVPGPAGPESQRLEEGQLRTCSNAQGLGVREALVIEKLCHKGSGGVPEAMKRVPSFSGRPGFPQGLKVSQGSFRALWLFELLMIVPQPC